MATTAVQSPGQDLQAGSWPFVVQLTRKPTNSPTTRLTNSPPKLHHPILPRREPRGIEQLHHRDPLLRRHGRFGAITDGAHDAFVERAIVARLAAQGTHVVTGADLAPAR